MTALLLAAFVQLFWQRELGLLHRALLDDPAAAGAAGAGEEHLLFADLVALATCAPLPKLTAPSPMRQLVRVEAARRARLGAAASSSQTLWRDLLRPGFFSLAIENPKPSKALYWTEEEREEWPGETLLVESPGSLCGKPPASSADELQQITDELVRALEAEPRLAALLAYERAALQLRAGKPMDLGGLSVEQLPPALQLPARFLRLEAGGDPREGFVPLAAALRQPIAVDRAAQVLYESGRFVEVVALTEANPPRYALWLRALALAQLGREDELLDALARAFALPGSEAGTEPLRELALQTLARRPLDEKKLAAFVQPGGERAALLQLGQRALAAGNLATARAAGQALADGPAARSSSAGLALQGEAAFVAGDAEGLRDALGQLFPAGGGYGRSAAGPAGLKVPPRVRLLDRDERDHAVVALAQALAGRAAGRPGRQWAALLEESFARMRDGVQLRYAPEIDRAAETLRTTVAKNLQMVALGEVRILESPQPPPPPKAALVLPEPFSLLAIPDDDGSLRSWFASPEVSDAR